MLKKLLLLILVPILSIGMFGCSTASKNMATETIDQKYETRIYEVLGMNCPGCHGGLEKLVRKIPEVQDAVANWEKNVLVVTVKPGAVLEDENIFDAIKRSNFTFSKRLQ